MYIAYLISFKIEINNVSFVTFIINIVILKNDEYD
jgi:hypothetical protein